jgi:hypothetical protein
MPLRNKLFLLLLITAFSCKKDDVPPAEFYYDYFPEKVGTWVESDVTYIEVDEISNYSLPFRPFDSCTGR